MYGARRENDVEMLELSSGIPGKRETPGSDARLNLRESGR